MLVDNVVRSGLASNTADRLHLFGARAHHEYCSAPHSTVRGFIERGVLVRSNSLKTHARLGSIRRGD